MTGTPSPGQEQDRPGSDSDSEVQSANVSPSPEAGAAGKIDKGRVVDDLPDDVDELAEKLTAVSRQNAAVNLSDVNAALRSEAKLAMRDGPPTADVGKHLDEIADDMLCLLQQVGSLQGSVQDITARLDRLDEAIRGVSQTHGRELSVIRNELLWTQRAQAATTVFEQIIDPMQQFRRMRAGLHPKKDKQLIAQLDCVINILDRTIRLLGFERFDVKVNEAFDPQRMVCRGYTAGKPGVVLKVLNAGYRADRFIVRPAEVMIADPIAANQQEEDGDKDS